MIMPTYFKPLRQKFGVVTLVLALMAMGGWMRSRTVIDEILIRKNPRTSRELLVSFNGSLGVMLAGSDDHEVRDSEMFCVWPEWSTREEARSTNESIFSDPQVTWNWCWCGFGDGRFVFGNPFIGIALIRIWLIPYWSIVLLLTAVSAWFLLSKPNAKIKPPSTPASEDT